VGKIVDDEIKDEVRRLARLFAKIDNQHKKFVSPLIGRVAFLTVSLQALEEQLKNEGLVIEFDNGGNQTGVRSHPAAILHVNYTKNLALVMKQLAGYLPESEGQEDELMLFLQKHNSR